jgi:preprotein translocase SecE subunit
MPSYLRVCMIQFLKDAQKELEHVVWPTRAETKKYFTIVVAMISVCTVVLFLFGSSLTNLLFSIRAVVTPLRPPVVQNSNSASDEFLRNISVSGATTRESSGSGSLPATSTGSAPLVSPNQK